MSYANVRNLLRIAASVSKTDPVLGERLERSALAVINPGRRQFEQTIEDTVELLKGLRDDLIRADRELDTDDAKEFAKFFDSEAAHEEEELRQLLKIGAVLVRADETAGVMDKVKSLFKRKKKPEPEPEEESWPSYSMGDDEIDEFVEGKRSWQDPGASVEKEARENKDFFEDAGNVVKLLDRIRDKPSRRMVRQIIEDLTELIERGTRLMRGQRKKAPALDESRGKAEPPKSDGSGVPKDFNLENIVLHYADMFQEASGDPKKLAKYLKEFFNAVRPVLEEDRATLASKRAKILPLLVRTASANPGVRPVLLPVIRRWTGR